MILYVQHIMKHNKISIQYLDNFVDAYFEKQQDFRCDLWQFKVNELQHKVETKVQKLLVLWLLYWEL